MQDSKSFIETLGQVLKNSKSQGGMTVLDGKDLLYHNISKDDEPYWKELVELGDDISIQNILKAKKAYLLTHVIGDPNNSLARMMRNNEAHYGNIALHNRMANSHDESILRIANAGEDIKKILTQNKKGADYLLRYYEQKLKNAQEKPQLASQKIAEIEAAICAKDSEGKTPLLLACKTANQNYAIRLINVDVNKKLLMKATM